MTQYFQVNTLESVYSTTEDGILGKFLMREWNGASSTATQAAKKLIRFTDQWKDRFSIDYSMASITAEIAQHGFAQIFRALIEADKTLLVGSKPIQIGATQNNFVQQEIYSLKYCWESSVIDADILTAVVCGSVPDVPYVTSESIASYFNGINILGRNYAASPRNETRSLLSDIYQLSEEQNDDIYGNRDVFVYQAELLRDPLSLNGTLANLDFLLENAFFKPPSPLLPIQSRRCGILRWLVEKSYIVLDEKASTHLNKPDARKLEFLGGQRIPQSVATGTFLSFACVEFDSLHALDWLVNGKSAAIDQAVNGFNFLHACAFFGRMEIILWLYNRSEWVTLISTLSSRKGYENLSALHISVKRGFVNSAELLITLGHPLKNETSPSLEKLASMSQHQHVREWAKQTWAQKKTQAKLAKDISKLASLLTQYQNSEEARNFIHSSKCLAIDQWNEAGVCLYTETLPNSGLSYKDVITACIAHPDQEFVLWMCHEISDDKELPLSAVGDPYRIVAFWTGEFHTERKTTLCEDLIEKYDDEDVRKWLQLPWAKNARVGELENYLVPLQDLLADETCYLFRKELFLLRTCHKLLLLLYKETSLRLSAGSHGDALSDLIRTHRKISYKSVVLGHRRFDLKEYFDCSNYGCPFSMDGHVPLQFLLRDTSHVLIEHHWPITRKISGPVMLYRLVVVENYLDLTKWLYKFGEGWSPAIELEMVRMAAYLGQNDVLNFFLHDNKLASSPPDGDMRRAALLGAAEGGRALEFTRLADDRVTHSTLPSGFFDEFSAAAFKKLTATDTLVGDVYEKRVLNEINVLSHSLPAMIVYGYLSVCFRKTNDDKDWLFEQYQQMMKILVNDYGHDASSLFDVSTSVLATSALQKYRIEVWESLLLLVEFIHDNLGLDFAQRQYKPAIEKLNYDMFESIFCDKKNEAQVSQVIERYLSKLVCWGVDIQNLNIDRTRLFTMRPLVSKFQEKQQALWDQFNFAYRDGSLDDIQNAVNSRHVDIDGMSRDGLKIVHLAVTYDRVDILEWLVDVNGVSLSQVDREGRNCVDIAKASKAQTTLDWIQSRNARTVLSSFLRKNFRRRMAKARKERYFSVIVKLQACQRGRLARKSYRSTILLRLKGAERFKTIWAKSTIRILESTDTELATWSSLRSHQESRSAWIEDVDEILETGRTLDLAITTALDEASADDSDLESHERDGATAGTSSDHNDTLSDHKPFPPNTLSDLQPPSITIHLSTDVVKWLKRSDSTYRSFFVRRIEQLQRGDRSRILAKVLKGSTSTIYETYLEQKSGHRILWQEEPAGNIFVWYVAKHKHVSRLMRLIDDCERRSSRQRIPTSMLHDVPKAGGAEGIATENSVRLNPLGNVPLKIYKVQPEKLTEIIDESWAPQLYLSNEEKGIVETKGTVLILGRSGTGKAVCICTRMDLDRQRFQSNPSFKQLFVARSQRLCRYVSETVGHGEGSAFSVFSQLVQSLEDQLPRLEGVRNLFLPSLKMDFSRFKREVKCDGVDSLVAWTSIRTFLKGSIEAITQTQDQFLDKEAFLTLGKKRCRLVREERELVYEMFTRYQKARTGHPVESPKCRECTPEQKLQLDEIQDYTQCEILLFFWLSGPGDLFLAGDPAQSVVEGVDFRFEDIRSVGYHVADHNRDLIPQKPKTVTLNFRSHSGILDVAAAILRCMVDAFPDSAKQLGEDRGVFSGPRPGVFQHVALDRLKALISEKLNGAVILTHDASALHMKRVLDYQLVYGIRAAKGLEFKSVILVDFFAELPTVVQKPWRNLLLGREGTVPELEGQLKLLYTAVTRCVEHLFIAETRRSHAGDAFVRWLTTTSVRPTVLATRQNVDDVEKMAMSQDEWVASGLDSSEMAEMHAESNNLLEAQSMMDKAVFCFEQGKDLLLARKARTYRTSLSFRLELQNTTPDNTLEIRAAAIVERLCAENLLLEVRRVLETLLPHMDAYTRERFEKSLLSAACLDISVV